MCEKYVLDRLNKKTKTYLIFAVEPVRNPDLGPEAPRGVPAGDSIMILEKIIEIQLRLRLQYKLTTLGKKLLMHFYKIWVLQLDLALRYDFIHILFFINIYFSIQKENITICFWFLQLHQMP